MSGTDLEVGSLQMNQVRRKPYCITVGLNLMIVSLLRHSTTSHEMMEMYFGVVSANHNQRLPPTQKFRKDLKNLSQPPVRSSLPGDSLDFRLPAYAVLSHVVCGKFSHHPQETNKYRKLKTWNNGPNDNFIKSPFPLVYIKVKSHTYSRHTQH